MEKQIETKIVPFLISQETLSKRLTMIDDMEIVVVSDTVRQRRSRTPLSIGGPIYQPYGECNENSENVMPDVLPKTFHLVESSPLFSQINNSLDLSIIQSSDEIVRQQKVSIVEIRESNLLTPKKPVNRYDPNSMEISENVCQVLNSCSILESVNYLEPCNVETVHIIDATSEPSDSETHCSTPNLNELDGSDSDEYETGEPQPKVTDESEHRILLDKLDLSMGTENKRSFRPRREHLNSALRKEFKEHADQWHSNVMDIFDEPLTFSDDDDNEVDDIQCHGNSTKINDRHTVLINQKTLSKPQY